MSAGIGTSSASATERITRYSSTEIRPSCAAAVAHASSSRWRSVKVSVASVFTAPLSASSVRVELAGISVARMLSVLAALAYALDATGSACVADAITAITVRASDS